MFVRVLYHDHCFDGAASAAFFSRFYRDTFHGNAQFAYTGMAHKASQIFEDHLFDGEENAIVDFKYSPHPKLTWWFDHHQSAFLNPEDAEHFRHDTSGRKMFDPEFRSCTNFIAAVARERWNYHPADLDDLVKWADIIDGAQYNSAQEAVDLGMPAMKLTLLIEGAKGSGIVQKIIGWMMSERLSDIIEKPEVQEIYQPLYQRHQQTIDIIGRRSACTDGVVWFDLVEDGIDGYNKFIPYYLYPESVYTVSVSVSTFRAKVSVGSNPWAPQPLKHNLATICERYGGGGHPKVGAISFEIHQVAEARAAAAEIVEELKAR
ncbi:MAG: phosphoesterase [Candidatus Solibacter usitatus]|nr:phosphoesterase [Candidatus Solibacter usitatus]